MISAAALLIARLFNRAAAVCVWCNMVFVDVSEWIDTGARWRDIRDARKAR